MSIIPSVFSTDIARFGLWIGIWGAKFSLPEVVGRKSERDMSRVLQEEELVKHYISARLGVNVESPRHPDLV